MKKITPRIWIAIIVLLAALALAILSYRVAAAGTFIVSGNTASSENQPGWMFNRSVSNPTPFAFTFEAHSQGLGALHVGPVQSQEQSFVAELFTPNTKVSDFQSITFDIMIGQGGASSDTDQFVVSVFANTTNDTNEYDCRFDYKVSSVSQGSFSKPYIFANKAPDDIKVGSRVSECPATLDAMSAGSYIRAVSISMGDTNSDDTGLDAYFDNFELLVAGDATYYNFEPAPQTRDDCAGKLWEQYKFRNQGQCLKYVDKGQDTR